MTQQAHHKVVVKYTNENPHNIELVPNSGEKLVEGMFHIREDGRVFEEEKQIHYEGMEFKVLLQ